jgi:hypothetical protein
VVQGYGHPLKAKPQTHALTATDGGDACPWRPVEHRVYPDTNQCAEAGADGATNYHCPGATGSLRAEQIVEGTCAAGT